MTTAETAWTNAIRYAAAAHNTDVQLEIASTAQNCAMDAMTVLTVPTRRIAPAPVPNTGVATVSALTELKFVTATMTARTVQMKKTASASKQNIDVATAIA